MRTNGLLSMIGMQTELDYQIGNFSFSFPHVKANTPKACSPSEQTEM